jgi:hypothetical protein
MGMAGQAPMNYRRKHYISDNAIMRLRDFIPELQHRDDDDLRNLLDEAVIGSKIRRPIDFDGKVQELVNLEGYFGEENLLAIVAPNNRLDSEFAFAIVTVVSKSYIATLDSKHHATLGDVMRGKLPALPPVPIEREKPLMQGPPKEEWLVRYRERPDDMAATIFANDLILASDVREYVTKLLGRGVDPASIQVFRPVKTKVQVEIGDLP